VTRDFFEAPILNSPYQYPAKHWELDETGQPTGRIAPKRRGAEFITPIPKPKKQTKTQKSLVFDEGKGLSTEAQQYDPTPLINSLRERVNFWRLLPDSSVISSIPERS
jgi:type III restriction enzyme